MTPSSNNSKLLCSSSIPTDGTWSKLLGWRSNAAHNSVHYSVVHFNVIFLYWIRNWCCFVCGQFSINAFVPSCQFYRKGLFHNKIYINFIQQVVNRWTNFAAALWQAWELSRSTWKFSTFRCTANISSCTVCRYSESVVVRENTCRYTCSVKMTDNIPEIILQFHSVVRTVMRL